MTSRRDVLAGLGATGATALAGCTGESGSENGDIMVGFTQQTSSNWGFLQPAITQAEKLAVKQVNDAGGPLGRSLSAKFRDTGLKPTKYREVVQQFINNDGAVGIVGGGSSEISAQKEMVRELGVPVVSNSGGGVTTTFGGDNMTPQDLSDDDWFWRTKLMDKANTLGAALQAYNNDIRTVGILSGTSTGDRSWADDFTAAFEELGGSVVEVVETPGGKTSYQAELSRLFEADFDGWALSLGLKDGVTVVREWANAGYGKQLILQNGFSQPKTIENIGEPGEGAWVAAATPEGPAYDQFISAYKDFTDEEINPWATPGYDAVNVISLAIQRAGSVDPEAIERNIGPVTRDGGPKVSSFKEGKQALDDEGECNYVGAATPCSFTAEGLVLSTVSIREVGPDGFEDIDTISASRVSEIIGR